MAKKMVYFFGGGKADGNESMKGLLGGKGANLAEMAGHPKLRLPVPPGFTITTEVCTYFYKETSEKVFFNADSRKSNADSRRFSDETIRENPRAICENLRSKGVSQRSYKNKRAYPKGLQEQVQKAIKKIEEIMNKGFGEANNPLLISVRSGARRSMPGMMETVLNIGLTEKTIQGLIRLTKNPRFVYDAYRRLIMMYSDVVMEKAQGIEPEEDMGIRRQLERIMAQTKSKKGAKSDTELDAEDLKTLCIEFKKKIREVLKKDFPGDHNEQLWGGIGAVFASWQGKRAVSYRRIENIPDEWGTAVTVQSMVFGNMGEDSATGVAFTRNPGNGENKFYGEYLINAQGEDVVAGIRTPAPINSYSRSEHNKDLPTLEERMPKLYKQLFDIQKRLERHYRDMQDIEFTIERNKLYMLQCRVGKRNGPAAVRMAIDMLKEDLIDKKTAVMRVTPLQIDELLHPIIDPKIELSLEPIAKGLPAGPGGATGQIVFSASDAVEWTKKGRVVILVREETNPEDVEGMRAAKAILTARGGMTSHAALVARGWGKCCIVGCGSLIIDQANRQLNVDSKVFKEGDWISLNGTKGYVYEGRLSMMDASEENKLLFDFLKVCDSIRKLKIRTNADTAEDSKRARAFGAEGIGLFRTEHMFYGKGSEEPLFKLRKMIISKTPEERRMALDELFYYVKNDIKGTLEAMEGLPVTIRLLDPPLHEFVPNQKAQIEALAKSLNINLEEFEKRAASLRESNPMMGHRGVRLGITYPEITEMQVRAILEASAGLIKSGKKVYPEIMIPVVCDDGELISQRAILIKIYKEVLKKYKLKKIPYLFGTMIEVPRACLIADKIAQWTDFFSFGTNDLTQMGFGFSRDDIGAFLPEYLNQGILPGDPFQTIDQDGIGELIRLGIERGRNVRKDLKVGICGEHGGDPHSIGFCHRVGMNYVSCSPFRVPIARLAAAQAAVRSRE